MKMFKIKATKISYKTWFWSCKCTNNICSFVPSIYQVYSDSAPSNWFENMLDHMQIHYKLYHNGRRW